MKANENSEDTLSLLQDLVGQAKKMGADAAEAVAMNGQSTGVSWHNGKLEDIAGNESNEIGLRVIIGTKQAIVSSSDKRETSLNDLVTRAIDMARAVPEDPYVCLADPDLIMQGPIPDLDVYDKTEVEANILAEMAAEMEEAIYKVKGVTNSSGSEASAGHASMSLVTSEGFAATTQSSSYSASVAAVAGEGTGMERDYDFTAARHFSDLKALKDIGLNAGEKAVKRLNPGKINSGEMPVFFDPRVANSLLGHFAGAINGTSVARGTSFLKDEMACQIFSDEITIIDDPLMPRGLCSRPFDGEGVAATKQIFVDEGTLTHWALNSSAARQLGLKSTGHATKGASSPPGIGLSNFYIQAGEISSDELMEDVTEGLYVTELIGMGVNGVTGDYSRGASGFLIKNGKISVPVNEITIAGNLKSMFRNMKAADDLTFKYGMNSPTLRVDGMVVASAS